jgi:hypothetical protein
MARHMQRFISDCFRNSNGWTLCSPSSSSSRMRSLVRPVAHGVLLAQSLKLYCADHEERIILFTRGSASDPDLPFGPLLRYVHTRTLECLSPMTRPTQDTRHTGRIRTAKGVTNSDRSPKVHPVTSPMLSAEIYAVPHPSAQRKHPSGSGN